MPLFEIGHVRCRLPDSGEKLKHKTEPTINKALIIIITDPQRIAELSYLVYCSCSYSE